MPSAVPTPTTAAQQTHPSPTPLNHTAGVHITTPARSPAIFQAPLTEMLPVAPAAATSHASDAGPVSTQLHSSQVLHDLQTSVSPMVVSQLQPEAHHTTPSPSLSAAEVTSPVALAPCSAAQPEAPTPTLLRRASTTGSTEVGGSPAVEPPAVFEVESPRNILSSLQQMNLQSKPFDFAENDQREMSPSVPEQAPEISQTDSLGPIRDQTPEPYHHSTLDQVLHACGITYLDSCWCLYVYFVACYMAPPAPN